MRVKLFLSTLVACVVMSACVPAVGTARNDPQITSFAHGVASDAAIAADNKQVLVGETSLGARPGDVSSRVRAIPLSGGPLEVVSHTDQLGEITGLAVADDGTVYVSRRATPVLSKSTVSSFRNGQETVVAMGTERPKLGSMLSPAGIAVAKSGDLIIADVAGSQILRLSANGSIERLAGTGPCNSSPLVPPVPGPALSTPLCGPELLASDAQGNVFVARKGSKWIARIDPNGALTLLATDLDVGGLAVDKRGALLASEGTSGRILRYQGGQSSVLVSGLNHPTSLAAGPDNAIYVLTEGSNDIVKIVIP